jgi:tetratricopeptide (TPR) repeat protein
VKREEDSNRPVHRLALLPAGALLLPAGALLLLAGALAQGCATAVPAGSDSADSAAWSAKKSPDESPTSAGSHARADAADSASSATAPKRPPRPIASVPPDRPKESWSQLVKQGRGHLKRRELSEAEDRFTRAFDLTRGFRRGDPRTTSSIRNLERLASAYMASGESTSFGRVMELLIYISSEEPAARTPELGRLLQEFAATRMQQDRPVEARDALELALVVATESRGTSNSSLVGIHAQLGLALVQVDDLDGAEHHIDRAAEIGASVGGGDSVLYARSLTARARLEHARGQDDEARIALEANVEIHEEHFGENHPATARVVRELAVFEQTAGNDAAAEAAYDRVIDIWDALPNEAYQRAQSRNELAWFLVESGQAKLAEAPARSALGMLEEGQVGGQPLAAVSDTLATALRDLGRYEEAERLYQEALVEGVKAQGLPGWDVGEIAERYAVLLEQTGRDQDAEDLRRRWDRPTAKLEADASEATP